MRRTLIALIITLSDKESLTFLGIRNIYYRMFKYSKIVPWEEFFMKKTMGRKIGLGFIGFLIVALFAYVVYQYFLDGPRKDAGFLSTKDSVPYNPWIVMLYIHIIFGTVALLVGPLQFNSKLRKRKKGLHRNLGKIYILSIMVSFIPGLYLSFYATGGITGILGFYSLEFAWIITTIIAFLKVKNKDFAAHQIWMYRSYAVTLTFVTFRIFSVPAVIIDSDFLFGLTVIFSWVFNLLIAEWFFIRPKKRHTPANQQIKSLPI